MPFRKGKTKIFSYSATRKKLSAMIQQKIARNQETKFRTLSFHNTAIDTVSGTPYTENLSAVQTGDDQNDRTGNQIFMTGMHFRGGLLVKDVPTGSGRALVRVIVYIPKDADDTLSVINVCSNVDQDQYTVLYDKLFAVSQEQSRTFTISRKWNKGAKRGKICQFYGTASTNFAKGPVKLYVVSDNSIDKPLLSFHGKLYYKDG